MANKTKKATTKVHIEHKAPPERILSVTFGGLKIYNVTNIPDHIVGFMLYFD